ncbi:MAG: hypothetical protein IJX22_02440 [Opitutales bacterium]|nr:hypothetical protein [Opitutales bacterium]
MTNTATNHQTAPRASENVPALNRYSANPETDESGFVKGYASPVPAFLMFAALAFLALAGVLASCSSPAVPA